MKLQVASLFVDDQARALDFYTSKLGFVKKTDVPVGAARWLTVVSPERADDVELLLEPNDNPIARTYQTAIYEAGMPAIVCSVSNIHTEFERLKALGVVFRMPPTDMPGVTLATFEDTCGNLVQLMQPPTR
jgi:predicted enzyme related to lactoylglutathione lyase